MKLHLLNLIALIGLFACSTTNISYNPKEFDTINYQKNVENALEAADSFNDFDTINIPHANLEPVDFSSLVQADIYFNEGDYLKSYKYYKQLSIKYKDPRIIYKAIVCLEHFSSTSEQITELGIMFNLFIQTNPDSQLAKLFQIKVALNQNNLSLAEDNLDILMKKYPQKGRIILLFVSSLLTGDFKQSSSNTLSQFGDYVIDNYSAYPEANLLAVVSYANANNSSSLANRLDMIQQKFPNWDIPTIWSVGLLLKSSNANESVAISILGNNLNHTPNPSSILQNMYIAILIKTANLTTAQDYTNFSIQHNLNLKNAMVNLAIINLIQNDYNAALTNLLATNLSNIAENSIIKLVIASIYDYQGKHQIAIKYYEEVVQLNQYLKQPLNWIILNNYALIGNKLKTDQILYDFAKSEKLDAKNTILLKVGFYINMNWYNDAYLLLKKNYTKYLHDPKYIYNYASMAAFTQNTKQAIALYKQYLKLDANNAIVYNDLAFVYAEQTKDYKSASIYANKAFELNPEDPNILDTYGWVYYKRGDFLNALKYVKASVDMQYNVESARHLKDIYIALNQLDQANAVIIIKQDIQANQRKQLLDKAVGLLNYIQFGIEIK